MERLFSQSVLFSTKFLVAGNNSICIFCEDTGSSLEKNWRRVVQEESLMNDHDEDNCQTFILDQNPWCESSAEQFRRTLDLFLHFFETLRFEGKSLE